MTKTGHGPHQGDRVHQLPGKEKQGHYGAAPAAVAPARRLRAASQPDSAPVLPDAQLQQDALRPASLLLGGAVTTKKENLHAAIYSIFADKKKHSHRRCHICLIRARPGFEDREQTRRMDGRVGLTDFAAGRLF